AALPVAAGAYSTRRSLVGGERHEAVTPAPADHGDGPGVLAGDAGGPRVGPRPGGLAERRPGRPGGVAPADPLADRPGAQPGPAPGRLGWPLGRRAVALACLGPGRALCRAAGVPA